MKKNIRVLMISLLLALGTAIPVVAALAPVQSTHPSVTRIADEPTPTPTPVLPGGQGGGCLSGGCPG